MIRDPAETILESSVLVNLIEHDAESFGRHLDQITWTPWLFEQDLSEEETQLLVARLDQLRDEPTVSFSSTPEAIAYLRSLVRRRK